MEREVSAGVPMTVASVILYGAIWAACHDICRERDIAFELAGLSVVLPLFAVVCHAGLKSLRGKARTYWTSLNAAVLLLFTLSAISAVTRPKFERDFETGAAALPAAFLLTILFVWQTVRGARRTA